MDKNRMGKNELSTATSLFEVSSTTHYRNQNQTPAFKLKQTSFPVLPVVLRVVNEITPGVACLSE